MVKEPLSPIDVTEISSSKESDLQETTFESSETKKYEAFKSFLDNPLQDNLASKIIRRDDVLLNENWNSPKLLSGKVIKITKDAVSCECLINKEKGLTQLMNFPRILFDSILELKESTYIKIKISQKPGSIKTDVFDGKGMGIESDFPEVNVWNELKDFPNKKF